MARMEEFHRAPARPWRRSPVRAFPIHPGSVQRRLAKRTVAILTSAALHPRDQLPFAPGSTEVRELAGRTYRPPTSS